MIAVEEKREVRAGEPGAPFALWEIWSRSDDQRPVEESFPEDGAADEALAERTVGGIYLEPATLRIVVRPRRELPKADLRKMIDWARLHRDGTDLDLGMSTAEVMTSDDPIEVAVLTSKRRVVRCRVEGCDTFLGWHNEDRRNLDKCEAHVACDRSTPAFRCRLIRRDGQWVPDYGLRAGMRDNPIENVEELAFALLDIASRARELNNEELVL
ncbi:hypothetical protein GCM10009840_18260 [Pseudolysinimonas kribbensis]|uniref:Uncharacterized protein n=1 Tax=Pseudolysinimonas kribbensis TaxID=433641 RepID=A0ABQ6JZN0_9MICO|nr:hypothetical protein [Pseudolysinimonas kribbensis]GMA93791.1 hypothetical protein GCM10025881_06150 [Pseudolysinimonas kribbensis]